MHYEFSEDENRVLLGSSRYRAEASTRPGACDGCYMKKGFGCLLSEAVYAQNHQSATGARCGAKQRVDGCSIVWVLDI